MLEAITDSSKTAGLLRLHPRISKVELDPNVSGCVFGVPGHRREIKISDFSQEQFGLTELIDNNPLICADSMSLPGAVSSAALVCLAPLLMAGIVQEPPTFVSNQRVDEAELEFALSRLGWPEGVLTRTEEFGTGAVTMGSGTAVIRTPEDPEELADLYEERFRRSLIIDGDPATNWKSETVEGKPLCLYRITLSSDSEFSLVTVRALCDNTGYFQAAQVVSALNIMSGFEDSLGLNLERS